MKIELAGFEFCDRPVSRPGSLFMSDLNTGEGTEIDEAVIAMALAKLFQEVM